MYRDYLNILKGFYSVYKSARFLEEQLINA